LTTARRRLLVTGDDLGRSAAVNSAVARCHRDGILTSASLMVAEPAAAEAVALVRELPELGTGLHLVLCDGAAASPARAIPDLATASGRLPATPLRAGLSAWFRRRLLRTQLEREIRTQFELYLETGLSLDHVDGHHHLHMHPVVFEIVQRCMEEHRVPMIRLVQEERAAAPYEFAPLREIVPAIFLRLARHHRRHLGKGVNATDRVWGLRATGRLDETLLVDLVGRMGAAAIELYTHPCSDTGSGRHEMEALCSPVVRDAVRRAGYELLSTRSFARRVSAEALRA
jgi:hopanoid biosynthesis associated protein HpnK